ncbi:MAG: ABC transporter permease [Terracidiphilus sp.]
MNTRRRKAGRRGQEVEMDREIDFHIAEVTEAYVAQGVPREEALRRARLEFGGSEQVKQAIREVHISAWLEAVLFNLRAALRFLRKSPSFSLIIIVTLALGIGANSAVFSAIDAVVLRPLPYPDGNQLVALSQYDTQGRDANHLVAPIRLEDWNRMNSTFTAVSGYYLDDISETSGPYAEKVTEALVAPRFFDVMGVWPALGRAFTADEMHYGGPRAVILSQRYWLSRFHGDPKAVGSKIRIEDRDYPVVGIMPASFQFLSSDVDLWEPSPMDAPFEVNRSLTWFNVIGRMKSGVTLHQAAADLATVQAKLGKQFPHPDAELGIRSESLKQVTVGTTPNSLWLLYSAVSLLLLIACSNIAALLLARTADREHEVSVRYSLGASRRSIVFQLLSEVFVLALLGSLAGLAVAAASVRGFQLLSKTLPRASEISLNWTIVLYTLLAAVATTFLCGLLPALRGTRKGLAHSLALTRRTQVSTRNPVQWVLVGVQVSLAVTLLLGAGLLLRSMEQLGRVNAGFDASHVLTFQVSGSWAETTDMKNVVQRINRTLDTLRTIPGIEAASTSAMLPGVSSKDQMEFKIDGNIDQGNRILADNRLVSDGYFETMRIPLLTGGPCERTSDTSDVVVNRSFASRYFNGNSPVGHSLEDAAGNPYTGGSIIRGIVGDAREDGLDTQPVPTVYFCYSAPNPFPNYLVRTQGDPMALAQTIRQKLHEIEPGRSVYGLTPLQQLLDDASSETRLRTWLLTLFAATAVTLACIGLYGTLSYLARLRQREVGVRLALGAMRGQIAGGFLSQGLRVALAGCVGGLILGFFLSRFLKDMLYGVTALDPLTYAGVVCIIVCVAALASLLPALRAARVEPVRVLREE